MNPAFSVVFLTTLSGAAQGLLIALVGVEAAAHLGLRRCAPAEAFYRHRRGCCRSCWADSACSRRSSILAIPNAHGARSRCGAPRGCRANVCACRRFWPARCSMACAHWFGSPWSLAIGCVGVLASARAVRLHGNDLRVSALFAGVGDAAHAGQFRVAWLRVGLHAGDGLDARGSRPQLTARARCLRMRADARGLREPLGVARAQCALASEVDGAERDRHQESRNWCRCRAALRPVRSICASSFTANRRARCAASSGASSRQRSLCRSC